MDLNNLKSVHKSLLGEYKLKLGVGDVVNEGMGNFVCTQAFQRSDKKDLKNKEAEYDEEIHIINTINQQTMGWYIVLEKLNKDNKIIKNGRKIEGFQDSKFLNDLGRMRVIGYLDRFEYVEEIIEEPKAKELKPNTKRIAEILIPKAKEIPKQEPEKPKEPEEQKDQMKLF